MDAQLYRELLLKNTIDSTEASGGSEIICRCYDCPDNGDHPHLYISIPQTEGDISKYYCFKCGTHGAVTQKTLAKWGIYDLDLNVMVSQHNRRVMSNPKNFRYTMQGFCKLNYKDITINKFTQRKLETINERLGTNLSFQDCIDNKIVLSIYDIFRQNNHITKLTRDERVVEALDKYFIGFISYDNNFINMKNLVCGQGILYGKLNETRYVNYNIFGKEDNSMKFILLPTQINICDPRPIKVHLAEGSYDILSVKYNLRNNPETDRYNNIFVAVAGNGYKGVLRHLITVDKLMNLEIHLYADNEPASKGRPSTEQVLNNIKTWMLPFGYPMYAHINNIGKDMGVSLDKINEIIFKI